MSNNSLILRGSYLIEGVGGSLKDYIPLEEVILVFEPNGAANLIILGQLYFLK